MPPAAQVPMAQMDMASILNILQTYMGMNEVLRSRVAYLEQQLNELTDLTNEVAAEAESLAEA